MSCDAFIPHFIDAFGSAPKHMGGVFGDSAPRAPVIVLPFPFDEGHAHTTIGGSMFSNPMLTGALQGLHAGGTGVPIDRQQGIKGKSLVACPTELAVEILNCRMQTFARRRQEFAVTAPHRPVFIVNWQLGGFSSEVGMATQRC